MNWTKPLNRIVKHTEKSTATSKGASRNQRNENQYDGPRKWVYGSRRKTRRILFLDYRTVDHKFNIISEVYVKPSNVHDSKPYMECLEHQLKKFGFDQTIEAVALDAGYNTASICHALDQKQIFAVIGSRSFTPTKGFIQKWRFKYDKEHGVYVCPQKHELNYSTTEREGYRQYKSNPKICSDCPV